jgi:hypothetical protein
MFLPKSTNSVHWYFPHCPLRSYKPQHSREAGGGGAVRPMSPQQNSTIAQGCDSGRGIKQSSLLNYMFIKKPTVSSPIENVPIIPNYNVGQQNHHINNSLTQQTLYSYLTQPTQQPVPMSTPTCPIKAVTGIRNSFPLSLNLYTKYFRSPSPPQVHPNLVHTSAPKWRQASLKSFSPVVHTRGETDPPTTLTTKPPPVRRKRSHTVRRAILQYNRPKKPLNRVTRYTVSLPSYDLFDSWGHTLESVDANSTFRVFLQNPNGLNIHRHNHLLIQDLQTCYGYGAGVLCFPETNTNWTQEGQL